MPKTVDFLKVTVYERITKCLGSIGCLTRCRKCHKNDREEPQVAQINSERESCNENVLF